MFEFDPDKSAANKSKHGIDFIAAQALWRGVTVTASSSRLPQEEDRLIVVGRIDGKTWVAIVTQRGTAVRIISVRRARRQEGRLYEQTQQNQG
ncbi:MAG: BrnT family toxin [Pseudomonadota bacterium]